MLFRNTNHVIDQNTFTFGARLEPAINKLVFSDETTLHLSGRVNRHNLRNWGSENAHESSEHESDIPKVNVLVEIHSKSCTGHSSLSNQP
jgi:hypothetical protein